MECFRGIFVCCAQFNTYCLRVLLLIVSSTMSKVVYVLLWCVVFGCVMFTNLFSCCRCWGLTTYVFVLVFVLVLVYVSPILLSLICLRLGFRHGFRLGFRHVFHLRLRLDLGLHLCLRFGLRLGLGLRHFLVIDLGCGLGLVVL